MRFSIRDLLWAMLVVALGLGWWVSYRAVDAKRLEAVGQAQRHRISLTTAKKWHDVLRKLSLEPAGWGTPDWSVLDERLVEP